MKPEKRGKDVKRKDRRKNDSRPFLQAPVILERRDKTDTETVERDEPRKVVQLASHSTRSPASVKSNGLAMAAASTTAPVSVLSTPKDVSSTATTATPTTIPFVRRQGRFNTDMILKYLNDHPGHFVIGVVGQQGVGKSTVLSCFTEDAAHAFPTQTSDPLLHKTTGIDMHVTPERTILLDTEPILSWSVLDQVLRHGSLDGMHPDLWLDMDALYTLVFLLSICNVLILVSEGAELDLVMTQCLDRAEMLKYNLPEYPLIPPTAFEQDMHDYPHIVFVCNKCTDEEFTVKKYLDLQTVLSNQFSESPLKTRGLVSLSQILPTFDSDRVNLFFLPHTPDPLALAEDATTGPRGGGIESFAVLASALRDQVVTAPRKPGKRGQVSEKDWFRNAVKKWDLVQKSEFIADYLRILRRLRNG